MLTGVCLVFSLHILALSHVQQITLAVGFSIRVTSLYNCSNAHNQIIWHNYIASQTITTIPAASLFSITAIMLSGEKGKDYQIRTVLIGNLCLGLRFS